MKGITGNLDYTDAIKYDKSIQIIKDNENKLELEFNNHISLSRDWMVQNSKIVQEIVNNQKKVEKALELIMDRDQRKEDDLIKYAHLGQYLLILGDNVETLSEALIKLESTLVLIRASGAPHSTLDLGTLKNMLDRLRILYPKDAILELNLREYYDIIRLGYYYVEDKVVIVYKVPIGSRTTYDLYKLSIAPNKNNQILIPPLPYLAIHRDDFVYIEAECPKYTPWYLCEEKINHGIKNSLDCIHQLITKQQLDPSCKPTTVSLTKEALGQLDDMHYILSIPKSTKVKTSCGQEHYRTLQGSFLAIIPHSCSLETAEFTVSNSKDQIKGRALEIMNLPSILKETRQDNVPDVQLNSINLENLQAMNTKISLQPPIKLKSFNEPSLYHTTIPMYIILLSTCVLGIAITYRHIRKRRTQKPTRIETPASSSIIPEVYTIPVPRKIRPSQIKIDPSSISATFSSKASNSS